MEESAARELRFYGLGALVVAGLTVSAGFRIALLAPEDRPEGALFFVVAAAIGGAFALWRATRPDSRFRQDSEAPGSRLYWRLVMFGVIVPILDIFLQGAVHVSLAGAVAGVIGAVLVATRLSARRARQPGQSTH